MEKKFVVFCITFLADMHIFMSQMLVKQIAPASWDRLRLYTSRVQKFDQVLLGEEAEESGIHDSVYARLGQMQPLFPALKEFHPMPSISTSNSFMFLLSMTITTVSLPALSPIGDLPDGTDFGPSLALLAWKVPGVRTLQLSGGARYSGLPLSLACFVDLQELEVLQLPHYDHDFINSVSSLKNLSDLTLILPPKMTFNFAGIKEGSGFPSVKTMHISGSPLELHKILKLAPSSVLHDLRLTCDLDKVSWEANRAGMPDLLNGLERFSSSLSSLKVATVSDSELNFSDAQFLWFLFGPLLRLKNLRELSYDLPLFLTDQRTAEIAEAWPQMETLIFTSETWGKGIPSIASLEVFVKHCPHLKTLEYPIQVQFGEVAVIPPSPTLSIHPLQNFRCIVHDDVEDPAVVALHLFQIFPELRWVDGPGNRWGEVQSIMDAFHFLSKQNRQISA